MLLSVVDSMFPRVFEGILVVGMMVSLMELLGGLGLGLLGFVLAKSEGVGKSMRHFQSFMMIRDKEDGG